GAPWGSWVNITFDSITLTLRCVSHNTSLCRVFEAVSRFTLRSPKSGHNGGTTARRPSMNAAGLGISHAFKRGGDQFRRHSNPFIAPQRYPFRDCSDDAFGRSHRPIECAVAGNNFPRPF